MIRRLTFREWSICVSLGEAGFAMIRARREARRAVMAVHRAVQRDANLHAIGIYRTTMSMGEGCTPVRVDPRHFYRQPANDYGTSTRK